MSERIKKATEKQAPDFSSMGTADMSAQKRAPRPTPNFSDMGSVPIEDYIDKSQPTGKDLYEKFDSTVKTMVDGLKRSPYLEPAAQAAISNIPIDPLTKNLLLKGDTTNFKEIYGTPALHALNQMLFNTPRALLKKGGYDYAEAETGIGNVLAKGAGIAGALTPFTGLEGVAARIPGLAGKGAMKAAGRGALAGAVQGFAYAPETEKGLTDWKTRGKQAGIGAVLGGVVGGTAERIGHWVKVGKKMKKRSGTTTKTRLKQRRINVDAQKIDDAKRVQRIDEATGLLDDNIKDFKNNVSLQQAQGKIPQTETAFKAWSKNLSEVYEAGIDEVSDNIGMMKGSDAAEYFDDLMSELSGTTEFKDTMAMKRISGFVDDLRGKKNVSFKDINGMRKQVLKSKFTGDINDAGYAMFREHFGNFVEKVDDSGMYAALNKKMSPQLNFKHKFIKKFRLYDKYETGNIEGLFKKYATGDKMTRGEQELMNDMVSYLGQHGFSVDDLANTKLGIKKSEQVLKGMKRTKKTTKGSTDIAGKERDIIRKKQDLKIDKMGRNFWRREAGRVADMAFRIVVARELIRAVNGMGNFVGGGEQAVPAKVQ